MSTSAVLNTTSQSATLSQHRTFRDKLAAFGKKISVLSSVVGQAITLFPDSGYNEIQGAVQSTVDKVPTAKIKNPWNRWFSNISMSFKQSVGSLLAAEEKLHLANMDLTRISGQVGGRLEQETTNPDGAERLIQKLTDAGLYRRGRGSQLNLLEGATTISSLDGDGTLSSAIGTPTSRLEYIATEVLRLNKQLDSLLYLDPSTRNVSRGRLNHNDAQLAFFLRDSIDGLVKNYGLLKEKTDVIPENLKRFLEANKNDLARACGYAGWCKELKIALGLPQT